MIVECPCPESEVHKHGIIEVNDQGKVTSFLEKPAATETKSRSQSPCFYLFDQDCQKLLDAFPKTKSGCKKSGKITSFYPKLGETSEKSSSGNSKKRKLFS